MKFKIFRCTVIIKAECPPSDVPQWVPNAKQEHKALKKMKEFYPQVHVRFDNGKLQRIDYNGQKIRMIKEYRDLCGKKRGRKVTLKYAKKTIEFAYYFGETK